MRHLLDAGEPLPLIAHVSALIAALDPRDANPFEGRGARDLPSLRDLVRAFARLDAPETSALLALAAAMTGDPAVTAEWHARRERRDHALPDWLAHLDGAEVESTLVTGHVLGDAENLVIGVRLAGGHALTALVFVDHNAGSVAADGFLMPGPVDRIRATVAAASDPDTCTAAIDPAEARARIERAIEDGERTFPPYETDTWPASRPAVEWMARLLPGGGGGYARPEWTDEQTRALADRFFASAHGRALDTWDARDLLESILWFGTDYGPGDPMRWSPQSAEILLMDWLPRKVVAEPGFLSGAPELVAAFTRFCHDERGVPAHLTDQTLAVVGELAPEYRRIVRSARLQGPMAILGAMGAIDPDDPRLRAGGLPETDLRDIEEILLDDLREAVGGEAALRALDATPLPDEPFAWDGIPEDVHDRVGEILRHTDGCCDALLGTECRTAARRLLALVARSDARVFRRAGRAETAAAALTWIVGQANHVLGHRGVVPAVAISRHLGLAGAPSQRAATLLRAAGREPRSDGAVRLGTPALLTSARRAAIIASRDRLAG